MRESVSLSDCGPVAATALGRSVSARAQEEREASPPPVISAPPTLSFRPSLTVIPAERSASRDRPLEEAPFPARGAGSAPQRCALRLVRDDTFEKPAIPAERSASWDRVPAEAPCPR